ncbi:hypothetical protein [Snodgrassella alvi]|uniref:Uncharacterized protein n=1 Tax=Snodgrassella alvi TaxID=1196083 RepID=A0A2N9XYS1_9NEIS|nr:hypothetical protein [Snodgrassella alvi]PIT54740.1 hypothetical protein BHC49_07900 [Snodgrassella alvi]PIT56070.1 hypothetical protein BHC49_04870 [Snodgrassella alvi]PIT56770.1 hypothetical protein BHC49_04125 [Snodgrassella alvi]PIT56919.1 hypothetical protein BHC49_04090 [Snodgrassella alvi]
MSLAEDFRKLFGNRRPGYERTPNRPRLRGATGVSNIPYGGDMPKSNTCLDKHALLHFNSNGQPSIASARAIEGLFEVNTGRQVRIFLDPSAVICENSDVKRFSDYIWYKLQLKDSHEAVLMGTGLDYDLDFFARRWWMALDLLDLPGWFGKEVRINPKRANNGTLKDVVYKMLKTNALDAKAFFTTVPIKENLLATNRDDYKKAVKQIFDFICTYINEGSKYNRDAWLELYASYHQKNSLIAEEMNFTKLLGLIKDTERYAGKKIPEDGEMVYTWKTPAKPFLYGSAYNWTLDARQAYWGLPADNYKVYESRWKFADDLVYGVSLIKDYALQSAGITRDEEITADNVANVKFADHFIPSFDYSEGVQQYFEQDVTFYYRNKYDEDGNETGEDMNVPFVTLSDKGVTRLWSVDIFPDSAIIDLRFDPKSGKFIAAHPVDQGLLPENLANLSGLNLKDEEDNHYSITLTDGGFLLHSEAAGKTWKIIHGDYTLATKEKGDNNEML